MNSKLGFICKIIYASLLTAACGQALAQTPADFMAWFEANQKAEATFKEGDIIGYEDIEKIRAFVPPGYHDDMFFPGMEVKIRGQSDLTPAKIYTDATEAYKGQATLDDSGVISNYKAGRPFDPAEFVPGDRMSGYKAAWNFNYRWQNHGLKIGNVLWVWVRKGGSHEDHEIMKSEYASMFQGGGKFERVLQGPYQRVYLSHRADQADTDFKEPDRWAQDTEFRELTAFTSPFDIGGTAFIIWRHDKNVADDAWAYVPSLRRVRRISAEVKTDSLLGTDHTLEDFYCYAGRVPTYDWKYIGTARLLAVARSRNLDTVYYGPNGWTPKDDWELREVDVFQMIPKSKSHPYSTKFIMTDRQNAAPYYCNAYDHGDQLWKIWQLSVTWTNDPHFKGEGDSISAFQSINVIDKQNDRGTLVPTTEVSYPITKMSKVKRSHDVNALTEGR